MLHKCVPVNVDAFVLYISGPGCMVGQYGCTGPKKIGKNEWWPFWNIVEVPCCLKKLTLRDSIWRVILCQKFY